MNVLKATKRSRETGGKINKLRSDGFIPAILYGGKKDNINLSLKGFVNNKKIPFLILFRSFFE